MQKQKVKKQLSELSLKNVSKSVAKKQKIIAISYI
jgi:hypothetical protein